MLQQISAAPADKQYFSLSEQHQSVDAQISDDDTTYRHETAHRWAENTNHIKLCCVSTAGADGSSEELLESTWPCSDLTARPCLASAASERHFSPGSPEETPRHKMLFLPAAALCCLCSGECFQPIRSQQTPPGTNTVTLTFICLSVSLQRWLPWQQSWFRTS